MKKVNACRFKKVQFSQSFRAKLKICKKNNEMFYPVFVHFLNQKCQDLIQNLKKTVFLEWSSIAKFI